MRIYVVLFILLLNVISAKAQTYSSFEKWMPKPTAPYSLKNTAYCESYHGGNAWVVYQIDSMQGSTIKGQQQWLMRMDMDGNNLWSKRLVCTNSDYVMSIVSTPDDGALLTGVTNNAGYNAGWLCKVDKEGNIQWAKRYNDVISFTNSIFFQTTYKDGYFYVFGNRKISSTNYLSLSKTDTLGNMIWTRHYKETALNLYIDPYFITSIPNRNEIILVGCSSNYASLIKTDTSGNAILWNKTYTPIHHIIGGSLRIRQIVPFQNKLYISNNVNNKAQIVVLDSLGNIEWKRYNTDPYFEYFFSIKTNSSLISNSMRGNSLIQGTNDINPKKYQNTYSLFSPDFVSVFSKSNAGVNISSVYYTSKIWMNKIDTTMTFECPTSSLTSRDTTLMKDTTSAFSIIKPTYNTTSLSILRTEPLNLQWTLECGKLAPSSIISHNSPAFNLVLYPNPAQESITIRTDFKNYELRLWDSYGKLLYTAPNIQQSEYMIPIMHLPQGTYHAECISNNQHYVQTFVKIQ